MISIVTTSMLDEDVDAICNPANGHLRHGGGLARIIDVAAQGEFQGIEINPLTPHPQAKAVSQWRADHQAAPLIATGNAYATSAGLLPQKMVIHAVGPIYNGGDFYEAELLSSAHHAAFEIAQDEGLSSIALPAISCGIFGFPVALAAPIAVRAARAYEDSLDIRFCLMEDAHVRAYQAALDR